MPDACTATDTESRRDPAALGPARGPGGHVLAPHLVARVLPGMVARGHGVEALCAILGLVRSALLDLVIELDLPTPHERPARKPGGRNPWTLADTALFVVLWMAGWHADSLGRRFGRSPDACRSKARRLGLPKRDREALIRPVLPGVDLQGGPLQGFGAASGRAGAGVARPGATTGSAPVADAEPDDDAAAPLVPVEAAPSRSPSPLPPPLPPPPAPAPALPLAFPAPIPAAPSLPPAPGPILFRGPPPFPVAPAPQPARVDLFGPVPIAPPPAPKPERPRVEWTRERDREVGRRCWARQHYKAIARDMGLPATAVRDRLWRLELPSVRDLPPDLAPLVDRFDPAVVEANIRRAGYVERRCASFAQDGKTFWFWSKRRRCKHTSDEYQRLADRRANYRPRPSRRVPPPALSSLLPPSL